MIFFKNRIFSKQRPYSSFFLSSAMGFLSLLFLSHCNLPKPQSQMPLKTDGHGNLFIHSAKGEFVATETFATIDLPKAKSLSFQVCIQQRRSNSPVRNQAFEIFNGENLVASAFTDDVGCLTWHEDLQFSFFKQSHNILMARDFVNRGRFAGQASIRFVVNPWRNSILSERDNDFKAQGLNPISLQNLQTQANMAQLRVVPMRSLYTVQEISQSLATYKIDFMGQLILENVDHLNQVFPVNINRATFRSRVTLLNRRKDGHYYLIHQTSWSRPQELKEAFINIGTTYSSNTSACKNGRLDFALEFEVVSDSIEGLRPFEMIYQGPNCQAKGFVLMVPHSGYQDAIKERKALSLSDYLRTQIRGAAYADVQGGGNVTYLQPLEFYPSQIEEGLDASFNRKKTVRVHTCLTSVVDEDLFRREELDVTTLNKKTIEVITDDQGCFAWNEEISINYFSGQCWESGSVHIQSKSGKLTATLGIGHISDGRGNVYRDLRYFTIPEKQLCRHLRADNQSFESEIYLSRMMLEKLDYTYEIDDFLNLTLVKRALLQINPFLRRKSLLDATTIENEDLPPGKYRVRLAIVDIDQKDFDRIDGSKVHVLTEKIVTIRAGSLISEKIEIRTQDLRAMANTNKVYISIEPLLSEENSKNQQSQLLKNLRTRVFSGPIIPQNHHDISNVEILDRDDVMSLIEKARLKYEEEIKITLTQQTSKSLFAKANHLSLLSLDENHSQIDFLTQLRNPFFLKYSIRGQPFSPKVFDPIFDDPRQISSLGYWLCRYWFGDYGLRAQHGKSEPMFLISPSVKVKSMIETCHQMVKTNFESVFHGQLQTFVQRPRVSAVDSAQVREVGVGQNFSQNRTVSYAFSQSFNYELGSGLRLPDIPGFKALSATLPVRYSFNHNWSESESHNMHESVTSGVSFNNEIVKLKIYSPHLERCLALRLNPRLFEEIPITKFFQDKPHAIFNRQSFWDRTLNPKLTVQDRLDYINSGVLICEGNSNAKQGEFIETFGILNQRMPMGGASLIDSFSNRARPFFVSTRGALDHMKLVSFMTAKLQVPRNFGLNFSDMGFREDNMRDLFYTGFPGTPAVTQAIPKITGPATQE
jgi:hypothetical protein